MIDKLEGLALNASEEGDWFCTVDEIKAYLDVWSPEQITRVRNNIGKMSVMWRTRILFTEDGINRFSTAAGIERQLSEFTNPTGIIYYIFDEGTGFDLRKFCTNNRK